MPAVGQCAICFSTLLSNEIYCVSKCGHTFHRNCIITWIATGKNCSSCRVKASERDVIKLFIQESNLDDTLATQYNPESKILEMESKMEKAIQKVKKLADEKDRAEADNRVLNRKVAKMEKDLEKITVLQVRLNSMESLRDEHAAVQRELAEANRKLKASDFYDVLTKKGKGTDEYKNYVDSKGAIIQESFSKLVNNERDSLKKRLEELNVAYKGLEKELKSERKSCLERKAACHKLTAQIKELNAKYEKDCGKAPTPDPKLRNIINYSPDRKVRQSLACKKRIIIDDEEDDENDTDFKPLKSSPQKKQKAFSFEGNSDSDPEWEPCSAPSTSSLTIATPVPRFTRHASLTTKIAPKFGTTIGDKRPAASVSSKKSHVPQVKTRSMDKYFQKSSTSSSSRDDSVVCLD
uniref:RING-type domain-containing protein n=1 Tax=Panagrolaimus superbus TaxID=310955 RepID=A0A914YZ05_9BILA